MFKVVISGFMFFMGSIWTLTTLWPNSSCERVAAFAAPLEWIANMGQVAAEPVYGYEEKTAAERSVSFKGWARNTVAKWIYSREGGFEQLCKSDPVYIMKTTGLLDHRNLLKREIYGKGFAVQVEASGKAAVKSTSREDRSTGVNRQETAPGATALNESSEMEGASIAKNESGNDSWFSVKMWVFGAMVLAALVGLLKFWAADNKAKSILEAASKPAKDFKDLSTHLLGRGALRPDVGPKPTDSTK